jgi:hypothetical protein
MNSIANSLIGLGEYPKAVDVLEKVYALECKILGDNHPESLRSMNNLARGYSMVNDHRKALEMYEKCYSEMKQILGNCHPDIILILGNLAHSYVDIGNPQKADKLLRDAYTQFVQKYGEGHPAAASLRRHKEITHERLVRNPPKDEKLERALRCRELRQQAEAYRNVGLPEKELEARQKLYELLCKNPGEAHSKTLDALHMLAAAHREYENHKKALELAEREYAIRLRVQGAVHADTEKVGKMVKSLRRKLGLEHPNVQKKRFLSSIGSFLRKPGRNQN